MVLRNVRVQKVFRIVSAVTIPKTICAWYRMGYTVIFNRLGGIPNVAQLNCAADVTLTNYPSTSRG